LLISLKAKAHVFFKEGYGFSSAFTSGKMLPASTTSLANYSLCLNNSICTLQYLQ
jgi:hypothetical protein